MGINLHFTEEDWARIRHDWTAFWAGELDRPMVVMPTYDSFFTASRREFTREFMLERPIDAVLDYHTARLENAFWYGDSWPKWSPYMGPGVMAGFLGGPVKPIPEQRTVWFQVEKPVPFDRLHFKFDPENIWWRRVADLTRAAVERWGNQVGIGHTDIGGVLDILASFRTTYKLLTDVYEAPTEIKRTTGEIRTTWVQYYDELCNLMKPAGRGTSCWAPIWSPGRTYMHQCDFSYMISPRMFEQIVLPDLDYCCRQMEHAFYHLDGKGQIVHLDMLLSLKRLKGIQWVPGAGQPPAIEWLPLLKRIRDGGKLCQVFMTADEGLRLVREIGGRGFVILVLEQWTEETASAYLKTIASQDISRRKR